MKTLAEFWKSFEVDVIDQLPVPLSDHIKDTYKATFFAGAMSVLDIIKGVRDLPTEEAKTIVAGVCEECNKEVGLWDQTKQKNVAVH